MEDIIVCTRALSRKVLCVAMKRIDGWCAYVDAVEGKNHAKEAEDVAKYGSKLTSGVASEVFGSGFVEEMRNQRKSYVY
jgi:hypothetical protein